jgi:hypothetical protein
MVSFFYCKNLPPYRYPVGIGPHQGDRIELIFAYWVIVYFKHCYENYRSSANFWATFFDGVSYVIIFTKKLGLATYLATFFYKLIWSPWTSRVLATVFSPVHKAKLVQNLAKPDLCKVARVRQLKKNLFQQLTDPAFNW